MRLIIATLLLTTAVAQAQAPLTGTTGAPLAPTPGAVTEQAAPPTAPFTGSARHARGRRTLQERFDDANATHDGHLTAEQARAKMPSVARDFDQIDASHKGYVTMDEIRAHAAARRAARHAAKGQR